MIHPLSTERRIDILILAVGLLVFIGLGLAAHATMRAQTQQRERIVHTRNVIETVQHLIILLTEAETGQRGFLLTRETAYREPYEAAIQQIPSDLHALRRLTSDNPDQQRRLETMTGLVEHRLMLLQRTLALSLPEAISVIKKGEGRNTMDQIWSLAAEIQQTEQTLLESRTRKHDTLTNRVLILKTTVSLVGVALLSIALLIILRDALFQAQARVLAAQAQLLDEAPVLIRDASGHTLMWNRGLERLYGWTKEAAVSQRSDELLATQRSLSHAALQRELDQKGMWTGEVMQRCRDESSAPSSGPTRITKPSSLKFLRISLIVCRLKRPYVKVKPNFDNWPMQSRKWYGWHVPTGMSITITSVGTISPVSLRTRLVMKAGHLSCIRTM